MFLKSTKERGCGLLEAVYQECLEIEMNFRNIPFSSQAVLTLYYKDRKLKQTYVPDFECYEEIIVELKLNNFRVFRGLI